MNIIKISILVVVVFLSANTQCHAADPWTGKQAALEAANQVAMFADWKQTRFISDNPDLYREVGCFGLIGEHPSHTQVDTYFAAYMASHLLISHFLPTRYREFFQKASLCLAISTVANNHAIGIRITF